MSSQGKTQCSCKTQVASECQDTGSEIFPFFFFPCRGSAHRVRTKKPSRHGRLTASCRHEGRRKQDTSGIYFKSLSHIWMAAGAKTNHASGRGTEAEQAKYGEQVKGKELGMTSRKGNSTDQRVFNVLHMLQPFKQHIMAPETF